MLFVTYWLPSLDVINKSPSLADVVVIADQCGVVTVHACAFIVLTALSATDLGALNIKQMKNNILLFVSFLLFVVVGSLCIFYDSGRT